MKKLSVYPIRKHVRGWYRVIFVQRFNLFLFHVLSCLRVIKCRVSLVLVKMQRASHFDQNKKKMTFYVSHVHAQDPPVPPSCQDPNCQIRYSSILKGLTETSLCLCFVVRRRKISHNRKR